MATTADHASDAVAAVTFLTTRPDIDARNVGIVGHSEGGWVGPIAATRSDDVSYLVLLAGVGMAGKDLLTMQVQRILEASGTPGPLMALNRELQDRMLTALLEADFESVGAETLQEQFEEMLKRRQILPSALQEQVKAELAWRSVVRVRLVPTIVIADEEIDDVVARIEAGHRSRISNTQGRRRKIETQ